MGLFDLQIKELIMGLMHAMQEDSVSIGSFPTNDMPPLSTSCNKGMENERKNLEVDDVLVVLPQDVWELIIKELHSVDYLRFGAVSKLWRSVAVAAKESPYFSLSPPLPWLVLSSNEGDVPDGYHGFFSLCHQKILKLKLPEMSGARCCGSSFGWLIMENKVNDTFLFHPFLSLQIQLPSQTTLPAARPKAILMSSPTNSNCFVVALYARQHVCFVGRGIKLGEFWSGLNRICLKTLDATMVGCMLLDWISVL